MKYFLLLVGVLIFQVTFSQKNRTYTSLEDALKYPNRVYKLNLEYKQITDLQKEIGNLRNLTSLNLSHNKLESLPESLGSLTNLTSLIISYNQISHLPYSIGELKNLTYLSSEFNQLYTLPKSIGNLTNLEVCDFSGNEIKSLPESFGNLTKLNSLYLWGNELNSLPESIKNINKSVELHLEGNPLLPQEIKKIKKHLVNCYFEFDDDSNSQLDEDDNLIGFVCGGAGSSTPIISDIYDYIKASKFDVIKNFIYSDIPEKQFLGVVFSEILIEKELVQLSSKDLKKISKIYKSKRTIEYCDGCIIMKFFKIKSCLTRQDSEQVRNEAEQWVQELLKKTTRTYVFNFLFLYIINN